MLRLRRQVVGGTWGSRAALLLPAPLRWSAWPVGVRGDACTHLPAAPLQPEGSPAPPLAPPPSPPSCLTCAPLMHAPPSPVAHPPPFECASFPWLFLPLCMHAHTLVHLVFPLSRAGPFDPINDQHPPPPCVAVSRAHLPAAPLLGARPQPDRPACLLQVTPPRKNSPSPTTSSPFAWGGRVVRATRPAAHPSRAAAPALLSPFARHFIPPPTRLAIREGAAQARCTHRHPRVPLSSRPLLETAPRPSHRAYRHPLATVGTPCRHRDSGGHPSVRSRGLALG